MLESKIRTTEKLELELEINTFLINLKKDTLKKAKKNKLIDLIEKIEKIENESKEVKISDIKKELLSRNPNWKKIRNNKGSSKRIGKLSNNELSRVTKIPIGTLNDWKKSENYRRDLFMFLKNFSVTEIKKLYKCTYIE